MGHDMKDGDLSNEVAPRAIYVFEGLVGKIPNSQVGAKAKVFERLHQWKRLVACYEIDLLTRSVLWDQLRRYDLQFDVVTFKGQGFADALERYLDRNDIPFSHCYGTTPSDLAKSLAYTPHVKWVIDPEPTRMFAYGDRGTCAQHLRQVSRWM